MEPYARIDMRRDEPDDVTYLPLMDCESKLLPIHFLTQTEVSEIFKKKKSNKPYFICHVEHTCPQKINSPVKKKYVL